MTNIFTHTLHNNFISPTTSQENHNTIAVIKGRKVENLFELIPTTQFNSDTAQIVFRKAISPTTKRISQKSIPENSKDKENPTHLLENTRPKTQSLKPQILQKFIKPSPVKARPYAKSSNEGIKGIKHIKRKKCNVKINQLMDEFKDMNAKKIEIPFSQNRYNGQYNEIAPILIKRNKEYLAIQKENGAKEKEKDYQKMIKRKEEYKKDKVRQYNYRHSNHSKPFWSISHFFPFCH